MDIANKGIGRKNADPVLGEAEQDLMTLVDLQRFLSEELADSVDISTDFSKSFTPLTDGLGFTATRPKQIDPLHRFPAELPRTFRDEEPPTPPMSSSSPVDDLLEEDVPRRPAPKPSTQALAPTKQARNITRFVDESAVEDLFDSPTESKVTSYSVQENRLKHAIGDRAGTDRMGADKLPRLDTADSPSEPPPLPKVGIVRRAMAALMDQVFVCMLAGVSLVLVMNIVSSSSAPVSGELFKELARSETLKFIVAGYAGLWTLYLVMTVGIVEATFGMWIWGMRIGYGNEQRFIKKVARIGLSLICQAFIFPALVLLFQRDGKNWIDTLSGTQVFRTQS